MCTSGFHCFCLLVDPLVNHTASTTAGTAWTQPQHVEDGVIITRTTGKICFPRPGSTGSQDTPRLHHDKSLGEV